MRFLWAHLFRGWSWRMAWRDSRSSRRRLLVFSGSVVLGIAALVAVGSFGRNLENAIEEEARTLLGADLELTSRQEFTVEEEAFIESLGGEQSREISFSSMIQFSGGGGTRLVQVRSLSGGFPYFGVIEAEPADAVGAFRRGEGVLVEESLLIQYGADVGDEIRIGELRTRVAGRLKKVPGETVLFATLAPRVFMSMDRLAETELLRDRSLARFKVYLRFDPAVEMRELMGSIRGELRRLGLRADTVEERQREMGRAMEHLYNFLNLIAMVALLLGGVGVASAVHVHVKQKLNTVAVLRCLGCGVGQTFAIYLIQSMALGALGAAAGACLGVGIQSLLPVIAADLVPFEVPNRIFPGAMLRGVGIGFAVCVLFSLLPLLSVRRIAPLAALRANYEEGTAARRDPAVGLLYLVMAGCVLWFATESTRHWWQGVWFTVGLGIAFALLAGAARLLVLAARWMVRPSLPYVWRQGLANLHRPNNRTVLVLFSAGLGAFLLLTLYLVQHTLVAQLVRPGGDYRGNAVLFDVQPDQREEVIELVRAQGVEILDEAAVVTMRLSSVKGRSVEELLGSREHRGPRWVLRREYRSTYNDRLRSGEKLAAGTWHERVEPDTEVVPVSLERGIAEDLRVELGDEMVFDVQGVPVKTRVASLREVDWRRVQPNFFVVFPRGVLEPAPGFHVLVMRMESPQQSAAMQRAVVNRFPNVSAIDLTLILETMDAVLGKIAFVVRFMALFTVGTGLLVLSAAILAGRFQRIRECVLLRTLGATRRQLRTILVVEYACLGLLASMVAVLLALGAGWALAAFLFEMDFRPPVWPLAVAIATVTVITVVTGWCASRGILNHPPLEALRAEA